MFSTVALLIPSVVQATNVTAIYGVPDNMMPTSEATCTTNGCNTISQYFSLSNYGLIANLCGSGTTKANVYGYTSWHDSSYDYATVFYKGHSLWTTYNGHNSYYLYPDNSNASDQRIVDRDIGALTTGTHHFAFMWTCGMANEQGGINGNDVWGMSPAFLDTASLQTDSYSYCWDNSGKSYIGFQYFSLPWSTPTGYNGHNYQNFATGFYYYLLIGHYTVRNALNQVSLDCLGMSFNNVGNDLYNGYEYYDPESGQTFDCKMRVFGDVNMYVP